MSSISFENFLAVFGFLLGVNLLGRAFKSKKGGVSFFVVYPSVALVFGTVYFVIYSIDPTSFVFNREISEEERKRGLVFKSENIDRTVLRIQLLDVVIQELLGNNSLDLAFDSDRHWTRLNAPLAVCCRTQVTVSMYDAGQHTAWIDVRLDSAYAGMPTATMETYKLEKLFIAPSFAMPASEFLTHIRQLRQYETHDLANYYVSNTVLFRPFYVWDFYYFSFTIIGAGDIIAAKSFIRLLVILQILMTVALTKVREK